MIYVVFVGLLAVMLLECSCSTRAQSEPQSAAPPVVAVSSIKQEDFTRAVTLTGEFRAFQAIDLHARVTGYVKSIRVDVGDRVREGQLLAILEIPELNEDLARAAAERKRADAELLRGKGELERADANRELVDLSYSRLAAVMKSEPGLVAQQELDEALGRKRSADAQVSAARASLAGAEQLIEAAKANQLRMQAMVDYSRITAPFAGVITKRYADTGAMVQSTPVVRLAEIHRLRLVVPAPESQVPKIRIGAPVAIRVATLSRTFHGTIARLSGDVQFSTRTMDVEVDVPNPGGEIVPGMYADAILTLEKRQKVPSVPVQALVSREGKRFVLVVTDAGLIEERPLEIGMETAEAVEALSGVQPGERVIIGDKSQLKPGLKVEASQGGVG